MDEKIFGIVMHAIYTLGLGFAGTFLTVIMKQKPSEQQKIMSGMTFFTALTMLGCVFGLSADNIGEMMICQKIFYTGACHVFLFQLMMMFTYCHVKPPMVLYPLLCGVNIIENIAALTMDNNQLFYEFAELYEYKGVNMLYTVSGPFHQLYLAMSVFYSAVLLITAIYSVIKQHEGAVAVGGFTCAALVPTAATVLHSGGVTNFDFTPASFLVSELIIFILIYATKIYDVEDTARQYVFDSLEDGIIVVDRNHRLKGYNGIATSLFPELKYAKNDTRIDDASPDINKIFYEKAENDICVGSSVYEPSIRPINNSKRKNHVDGYVIWLRDVTKDKRIQESNENYQRNLKRDVDEKTARIRMMQQQMIYSFATLVENRDSVTGEHVRRSSEYVEILAAEMHERGLYPRTVTTTYLDCLKLAAPLHDIGKINVPDSILRKPGKLSPEEYEIMKNHTVAGGKIIEETLKEIEGDSFYYVAKEVALGHHEKWDGSGYPYGQKGEEIPVSARIMAVADFFDALTSSRSYKKAYSSEKAYSIIMEEAGKSFDPKVVDCFVGIRPKVEQILVKYGGSLTTENDTVLSERDAK